MIQIKTYKQMNRIIIIGATSGIGLEVAKLYRKLGWRMGIAGRRLDLLKTFQEETPGQVEIQQIDITSPDASALLLQLIEKVGGMDIYFHGSGIGSQNRSFNLDIELATIQTNVTGFTRMINTAYHYFKELPEGGHIAVISSIAGTKGLGIAPSYSATKRYQNIYIDALTQLCSMDKNTITFTDIRPGFVQTDLLKNGTYPLLMQPELVANVIVKAIHKKKRRIIIDWRYRLLVFFWQLVPNRVWVKLRIIHN